MSCIQSAVERSQAVGSDTVMVIESPLAPLLLTTAATAFACLLLGFAITSFLVRRIESVTKTVLRPLRDLSAGIEGLPDNQPVETIDCKGIKELEAVKSSILTARRGLADVQEARAIAAAKEIVTEMYQRLIHDLYTPVSALQQLITLANQNLGFDERTEVMAAIPVVANEVVALVETAKRHLGDEISTYVFADIRTAVKESCFQARIANSHRSQLQLIEVICDEPVEIPHDPVQIKRAVSNLIMNAIEACQSVVKVRVSRIATGAMIQIDDDGPGMTSTDVSKFLQGKGRSTKSGQKAYGLAGANHIFKMHRGNVVWRPSDLGGSLFEVKL